MYEGKVLLVLFSYLIDFAKHATTVEFKGRWLFRTLRSVSNYFGNDVADGMGALDLGLPKQKSNIFCSYCTHDTIMSKCKYTWLPVKSGLNAHIAKCIVVTNYHCFIFHFYYI